MENRRNRDKDSETRRLARQNWLDALGNISMHYRESCSIDDYVRVYGGLPSRTVLKEMTQEFIKSYHAIGVDSMQLVDGYGLDWMRSLLTHNEEVEEYELCTIFRDLIIEYELGGIKC